MGIQKLGITFAEQCAKYAKTCGKTSVLQTKPIKPTQLKELKLAKNVIGDTFTHSKSTFKVPSTDKLKSLLKEQGMVDDFITDNNSLFLEELLKRFPIKQSEKTNKIVQDLMTCLEDINHTAFTDKAKFLDDFIIDAGKVDDAFKGIFTQSPVGLFSKRAVLQAKYNNPKRYQEIMDLLALQKQGKAPKWALQVLFPESSFHALPKSDMQKLLKGEHYYPQLTTLTDDMVTKLEVGEAFSVGKEMFVKTAKGYEKLKIDAQTYEKLFPPIERYALSQGPLGNCHLMATMDSIIKNPESRIEFYKMFEQVDNGVKCTLAGYKDAGIVYHFDDLSQLYTKMNMNGSLGHKMIEYTYATNRMNEMLSSPCYLIQEAATQKTKNGVIRIFDKPGQYDDCEDYLLELIGKKAESIERGLASKFKPIDTSIAMQKQGGISVANNADTILNLRKGLVKGHYYSANLNADTVINPWNTMEVIKTSPFLFNDITYVI